MSSNLREACSKRNIAFIDKDVEYNLIISPLLNKHKRA